MIAFCLIPLPLQGGRFHLPFVADVRQNTATGGKFEPQKFNDIGYEFKALQDTEGEEDEMNVFDPHQDSDNSHRTTSQNGQPRL